MACTVQPMTWEDFDELAPHVPDARSREHIVYRRRELAGFDLAARVDDKLIACGGVSFYWPGVGDAWIWTVPAFAEHSIAGLRAVRQWLTAGMAFYDLWRVEALIRADRPGAVHLARWLGFHREGTREHFGPQRENFELYARLREAKEAPHE